MKTEELRMGNKVSFINREGQLQIDSIASIINDGSIYTEYHDVRHDLEDIIPIPITEEWLLKFGFEIKYGNTFFKDKMKFDVNTIGLVRFHWSQKVTYIKYIHQLQNLYFSLTGSELVLSTVPASNPS